MFVLDPGIGLMSKSFLVFLRLHRALQDQNGIRKIYHANAYILVNIWLEMFAENVDQMKDGTENNVFVLQNTIKLMESANNVKSILAITDGNVSAILDSMIIEEDVKNAMYHAGNVKAQVLMNV